MKVGDLVRVSLPLLALEPVGIVLELRHTLAAYPDYRTPTSVLVFLDEPIRKTHTSFPERCVWFYKNELKLINSRM
jgi:hypothetical protein